jgi:hypothetical protein
MGARRIAFLFPLSLSAALLAACGGGGSSAALPPVQSTSSAPSTGTTSSVPAAVAISIAIPSASGATASAGARRVRYVSPATKSATVDYAGGTQTVNCTSSCTINLSLTAGTQSFSFKLYDAPNGAGNVLSTAQTTATIMAGTSNVVKVTFGGVVASVAIAAAVASVVAGNPASIPVTVTAKDAAGYTIVGSEPYATPIALSTDDSSGSFTLSASSVASPSTSVSLSYNGGASSVPVHLSASVPGAASGSASVAVQNAASSGSSAGVPTHIQTWYYYGLNDLNVNVPPAFMAAHADYVEADAEDYPALAHGFKAAGGKHEVAYTDAAYVAYCHPPFTPPAGPCEGSIGQRLATDEGAWLHGPDGARVHKFVNDHFQYQEALNVGSQDARDAYRAGAMYAINAAPEIDYIFADDSGGIYDGDDGTPLTAFLYQFNAAAVEIPNDAAFIAAEKLMLQAAPRPVFINGATPYTSMPSYNGVFLSAPNVAGQNFEGCYGDDNGPVADTPSGGPRWTNMSNALLATFNYGAPAVCMDLAPATPANRLYVLASWWMTYDPVKSILSPHSLASDGNAVVAEMDIVPTRPLSTAGTNVGALRAPGGAYVREFAACYQAGTPIGPCAAIVNPTTQSVPVPALSGHYANALVLDGLSAYGGGKAVWTGSIPAQLGPATGIIVR